MTPSSAWAQPPNIGNLAARRIHHQSKNSLSSNRPWHSRQLPTLRLRLVEICFLLTLGVPRVARPWIPGHPLFRKGPSQPTKKAYYVARLSGHTRHDSPQRADQKAAPIDLPPETLGVVCRIPRADPRAPPKGRDPMHSYVSYSRDDFIFLEPVAPNPWSPAYCRKEPAQPLLPHPILRLRCSTGSCYADRTVQCPQPFRAPPHASA
jgi:hypothetical protein